MAVDMETRMERIQREVDELQAELRKPVKLLHCEVCNGEVRIWYANPLCGVCNEVGKILDTKETRVGELKEEVRKLKLFLRKEEETSQYYRQVLDEIQRLAMKEHHDGDRD